MFNCIARQITEDLDKFDWIFAEFDWIRTKFIIQEAWMDVQFIRLEHPVLDLI